MSHALYRLGRFSARRPWTTIGVWTFLVVLIVGLSTTFGRELVDSNEVPGLDSQDAIDLLTSAQSDQAGLTAQVVLSPLDETATFFDSAEAREEVAEIQRRITELPNVISATDPASALTLGREESVASGSTSANGRVVLVRIQYPVMEALDKTDLDNLEALVNDVRLDSALQIETSGDLYFAFAEADTGGEVVGVVAAIVILLLAFGSVIAMGLPIGIALLGLAIGVSSMSLIAYLIDIPSFAPQMASMIGLGVGIDYALFLVTRHREFLARGMTVEESVGRAVATAGQAVVFAGGTVVIAILGLAVAGIPFMTAAGIATSLIVLIMVLASITLLPALLGLAGHSINRFGIQRRGRSISFGGVSRRWSRWGSHVSSHAWPYAIGVTVVLLGLTAPVLDLRLGFPDDGSLPTSQTQRRAYDLVAEGFGPGSNGPLVVAVDISQDSTVLGPLVAAISSDQGIAAVMPPVVDDDAGVATILAFPASSPQDDATVETIRRLRADVFPPIVDSSPAHAHIGGQTASFADMGEKVAQRLPLFMAAVIVLSFMLLTLVFRSILVPLKAALLNLLSIGAAYGVLVMVFQWGWGASLIGLESTIPVTSFIPMFMFAVLFGLSMDYEVFLLSRVREEYLVTGDNEASVIHGLAGTARVITSAALIMISVFAGFVLGNDPSMKMVGLGLATAIFVDASIVRMILVPATMKLMGHANWWIPDWLDRILPTIDIDGEAGLPEPELEDSSPSEDRPLASVGSSDRP